MLTKEEIEKLEPGRELDALIAKEVFGYEVYEKDDSYRERVGFRRYEWRS